MGKRSKIMFKSACYRIGATILIATFFLFTGCGGSESGLDGDESITAELTAHDQGDAASNPTLTIDNLQSICKIETDKETDEITKVTYEKYYDTFGQVTFQYIFYCPTCPPGADETYIIDSYTIEYIPRKSPDGKGGFFLPPKLVNLDQRLLSQVVLSKDFKTAQRSIILIPIATKQENRIKNLAQGTASVLYNELNRKEIYTIYNLYSIRVTFHGRNRAGNSFSFTSSLDVSVGPYNVCEDNN